MAVLDDDLLHISKGKVVRSKTQEKLEVTHAGATSVATEREAFVSDMEPGSDSETNLFSESDRESDSTSRVDSSCDSDSDIDSGPGPQKEPLSEASTNSRTKKESSITTYWNVWYCDTTKTWMNGAAGLYVLDKENYAHKRLRMQITAVLVLAGMTSTRPKALIGGLYYKDIEFHIKRSASKSRPKKYGFHEEDALLHDPIIYIEGDSAFQGRGNNISMALDKALRYKKARDFLIRLVQALGFEKQFKWYDLRNGSGKKLHKALTPKKANQSMGYTLGDSTTHIWFYITDFIEVDFQEIVNGDAPTRLTDEQKTEINQDPNISKIRRKQDYLGRRLFERYSRYHRQAESLKKRLHDQRLSQAIQEFYTSVYREQIRRQLNERAWITKLFAKVANVSNTGELHQLRIRLVRELALLCKRRENPRRPGSPKPDPSPKPAYSPKSATFHKPAPTSKPILLLERALGWAAHCADVWTT
ncbi:hypothetical protein C7999DRAFT_43436 [Corynascus novoguineensis]|uniref:Uncharacterized protein n=1 Tax=Corynascus novoguineensis TaxID=1126955 RepID=A0AAN7CQA1_9PEZI|nr:hypothetical protein C7999DRAFT_43436 [Corynascus novoguineensis]